MLGPFNVLIQAQAFAADYVDMTPDDRLVPPEANYRRLSTPQLQALRAELIATRDGRRHSLSREAITELVDELKGSDNLWLGEFVELLRASAAAHGDELERARNEPFFDNRIVCVDRILAERPDAR